MTPPRSTACPPSSRCPGARRDEPFVQVTWSGAAARRLLRTGSAGVRRQRVLAAGLDDLLGGGEPDQRQLDLIRIVPAGERLDDHGLAAGRAVREQLED